MKKIRGRGKFIFLILILILILSGGVFFIQMGNEKNTEKTDINKESLGENEKSDLNQEDSNEESTTKEGASSVKNPESGGGSGGNVGGGTETSSEIICTEKQISYSMENLNKTSVCNANQDGICTDKTVSCSVEIHNLDNDVGGIFKLELIFLKEGGNKLTDGFDITPLELSVNPKQSQIFSHSTNIQSTGTNGTANKEINCFYNTLEVPRKEVCL